MLKVNHYINEEKRRVERIHYLMQISRKMYDLPSNFAFFEAGDFDGREYFGQGPLEVLFQGRGMVRQVIVFSDAIILARKRISPTRGSRNLSFRLLFCFASDSVRFQTPSPTSIRISDHGKSLWGTIFFLTSSSRDLGRPEAAQLLSAVQRLVRLCSEGFP